MARYLPKSKQTKPQQAFEGEFLYSSNQLPFQGQYVQAVNGTYYAFVGGRIDLNTTLVRNFGQDQEEHGASGDSLDQIPRDDLYFDYVDQRGDSLTYTEQVPELGPLQVSNPQEIAKISRYFVRHKVSGRVFEVSPQTYNELQRKTATYHWPSYDLVTIIWRIKGEPNDIYVNGYLVKGVSTTNQQTLVEAEKILPGITKVVPDPLQYWT